MVTLSLAAILIALALMALIVVVIVRKRRSAMRDQEINRRIDARLDQVDLKRRNE
ncbi:hypothetical protein H8A99_30295 [Bradyrhizobium sp. Arg68]|uniref:hypothetical protein n=1 Tax=Bradyrhizobium ivorense TaxID=2511166 RepID=UPI001E520CA3|nr:hypothetical protein [Bradyrhizobium ivorense]MCC8940619.1 hypothetical protein [Bradyrhizobium ivorense]